MKTLTLPGLAMMTGSKDCCAYLALDGEADMANADAIETEISALAQKHGHVLLDCQALTFIDSSGLKALLEAHEDFGGNVALISQNGHVRRILEITGLWETLAVFESEAEARDHLHGEASGGNRSDGFGAGGLLGLGSWIASAWDALPPAG